MHKKRRKKTFIRSHTRRHRYECQARRERKGQEKNAENPQCLKQPT